MRRGTSPYVKVTCGQDWSEFKEILFTMKDNKGNQVNKTIEDFDFEKDTAGNTILYSQLTQQETLSFNPKSKIKVQIRVLDEEENAYASPIYTMSIDDVLFNREIRERDGRHGICGARN